MFVGAWIVWSDLQFSSAKEETVTYMYSYDILVGHYKAPNRGVRHVYCSKSNLIVYDILGDNDLDPKSINRLFVSDSLSVTIDGKMALEGRVGPSRPIRHAFFAITAMAITFTVILYLMKRGDNKGRQ